MPRIRTEGVGIEEGNDANINNDVLIFHIIQQTD
jgi:hypothetical protein